MGYWILLVPVSPLMIMWNQQKVILMLENFIIKLLILISCLLLMKSKRNIKKGEVMPIKLHDGSKIVFRKVDKQYDPTDRAGAYTYLRDSINKQEVITGLLYIDKECDDMHEIAQCSDRPLSKIPYEELVPSTEDLAKIMNRFR